MFRFRLSWHNMLNRCKISKHAYWKQNVSQLDTLHFTSCSVQLTVAHNENKMQH